MPCLISTCYKRMGIWGNTVVFRELQSHYNYTSGLRKYTSDGKNHLELPWCMADMEIETEICDLGSLAYRSAIKSLQMRLAWLTVKLILWLPPTTVEVRSMCIWWLFTHQKVVSLGNARLYAFFPPPGQQTAKTIISCLRLALHHRILSDAFPTNKKD